MRIATVSAVMAVSAMLGVACRQAAETEGVAADTVGSVAADSVASHEEEAAAVRQADGVPRVAGRSTNPAKVKKPSAAASEETLYVETEGMQGRVWGYVTMHGDTGAGTIHDWDENTLSITVTRHGYELYAVDQNSRHYVFRLK